MSFFHAVGAKDFVCSVGVTSEHSAEPEVGTT